MCKTQVIPPRFQKLTEEIIGIASNLPPGDYRKIYNKCNQLKMVTKTAILKERRQSGGVI